VARLDPSRRTERGEKSFVYGETPYDYGDLPGTDDRWGLAGIIATKDQGGSKGFQDGIGVNMQGDVAEQCNIYHVPKMDDEARAFAMAGSNTRNAAGVYSEMGGTKYGEFVHSIAEAEKRGEETYFIRRQPGIPLAGATVWTFDATGEVREKCAVNAGGLMAGVQIDENGNLYFVNDRLRVVDGKDSVFLAGKGGVFGEPDGRHNRQPLIGTLIKTRGKGARVLLSSAPVPLEEKPTRPPDLFSSDHGGLAWVEGAEWFYAGASPIVFSGCECPSMRFHTDWYKRSFVPEAYRHSIGALDGNGNLILHIGRYGNHDSADGPKSRIPVGGDGIAMTFVRFVGGTDDRLVFEDHGERIVVLKLNYHAEETVQIQPDGGGKRP
jgi:hypothetical protein